MVLCLNIFPHFFSPAFQLVVIMHVGALSACGGRSLWWKLPKAIWFRCPPSRPPFTGHLTIGRCWRVSCVQSASTLPPALSSCHPCSMMPVDKHRCASLRVVSAVVGTLRGWRRTSPCRSCQSRSLVCMTSGTKHGVPCNDNSNLRPDSNIRGNFCQGAKGFAKHALTGHVAEASVSAEELLPVFQSMVSVVHMHDTSRLLQLSRSRRAQHALRL